MTENTFDLAACAIDAAAIQDLKSRRYAGESLKSLAAEIGLSWQRLWGLLYTQKQSPAAQRPHRPPRIPAPAGHSPVLQVHPDAGRLVEKYRPRDLRGIWGQDRVVAVLRKFVAKPTSTSFLFEGETGTGKTSAALALAAELGCDVQQGEFGGVHQIASGEQTADTVRSTIEAIHNIPFYGSGWKVLIVNEADRMSPAAETIWLDRLEHLPRQTVVIFTTNYASRLQHRLLDRCRRLKFVHDAAQLRDAATALASAIWKTETGKDSDPQRIAEMIQRAISADELSFRRVVQELTEALVLESSQ